jgi:hypothetical protein
MHPEVLTKPAAQLFDSLARFRGFYLAGGTALALQIGHRVSIDFDLFSDKKIEAKLLLEVRRVFPQEKISPLINNLDELTALVNGVKLTFLRYPYPPDEAFTTFRNVPLLSVRDIAVTKAYTIGRRGSYKDYVDLYYILVDRYTSLPDIIRGAEQRYGADFNSRLFLDQLLYTADLKDSDIKYLKEPVSRNQLLALFEAHIRACAQSL